MLLLNGLDGQRFAIRPDAISEVRFSPVGTTIVLHNGKGHEVLEHPQAVLNAVVQAAAKRDEDDDD